MRLRSIVIVILSIIILIGFLAYQVELIIPGTPSLGKTYTPVTQSAPSGVGSYDILGRTVDKAEAAQLSQTDEGREKLAPENGAVAIDDRLLSVGRKAFYSETFKNEVFFTDVTGILNGPLNIGNLAKAIASLKGKHTTNLQVSLDRDMVVGDRALKKGTILNTGLDVATGSLVPLGIQTVIHQGKIRVGVTCAACHAAVDSKSGRILEGAPNNDLDTGLILALASNSAAWFRQTGVNPLKIGTADVVYTKADNKQAYLPDAQALEKAVDAQLLTWSPGNFDSTGDNVNNPSQNPSSYTHEAFPYGWSGNAAIGWFHGLTTLNSNVHGTNSDLTTGADASQKLLGIDRETYLGVILQNSANSRFRLPKGAKPSEFFQKIDPTPGVAGMNEVIPMPGYPKGSPFILDGLMASSPGYPVGQQINGMSAWQNTLAPPANNQLDKEAVARGAKVFSRASCVQCHSGRYFTNHDVIPAKEILTQPSRATAFSKFPRIFTSPQTYPSNVNVPLPPDPPVLDVPVDITPLPAQQLALAQGNAGGYKVPSLIGLHVTAPYLHDGGVAAGVDALTEGDNEYQLGDRTQLGMAGTLMQNILPDPSNSLRVLLDRRLREKAIAANKANPNLQKSNVDGSGHNYWVDRRAGYSKQEQTDLIQYLLSLDDEPEVLSNAD
ncbi:di-heme oxidoredictase family protein [Aliterella atlantica]|uniref:Cytochrome c domain-containing protein n=1 Tax=Aliterella atlantica CENA595 TaxID=1618023 RepID=A0A0D8ZUK6_9CYAN|nr:di-heme oxidoredictase family protein [Aliterella atlantica]KJH72405.1 hypothetical protein UH38_06410 [Aliterella atlantica CENA595]